MTMQTIMDRQRYAFRDAFTYTIGIPTADELGIDPNKTTTLSFNIDGESDFYWDKATVFAMTQALGTSYLDQQLPGVLITITDTLSQRTMMNNPTPVANIFGTGRLPMILPIRKLFLAKTTVRLTVQNITDNINYSHLYFSFIGIKAYRRR